MDKYEILSEGEKIANKWTQGSRFDLLKGVAFGYLLGRFRAAPVVLGLGTGILLDSYVRIPNLREKGQEVFTQMQDLTK